MFEQEDVVRAIRKCIFEEIVDFAGRSNEKEVYSFLTKLSVWWGLDVDLLEDLWKNSFAANVAA